MKMIQGLLIALILLLGLMAPGHAQPPAQGPDAPGPNASSLPGSIFTGLVKAKVEEVLTATNEDLAARNDFRARLSYSFTEYNPRILSTQYTDRPNQRYVHIPYIFTYTVSDLKKHTAVGWIGYPWSRKITQSIAINISCNRWFAQPGELMVSAEGDEPYLEAGHSISEQALNAFLNGWLPDYIDSKIRAKLRSLSFSTSSMGLGSSCNQLGVATIAQGFPFNSIEYKVLPRPKFDLPNFDNVTVKVVKIKRLRAQANGQPLYQAVENVDVDFYVNQQFGKAGSFTMSEGDEAALTPAPISFRRPAKTQNLVLIFNVRQANSPWTVDSNYTVHTAPQNFGHGTQTVKVYKSYWMPPRPPINKPLKVSLPAYEITYEVIAPQIVIQQ